MNHYVIQLHNSERIRNIVKSFCIKQNRYDLEEDLFHYCLWQLLEKDIVDIERKLIQGNETIENYFLGIVKNQINSNTSPFYKEYRNGGFNKGYKLEQESKEDIQFEDEIEDKITKDIQTEILLEQINRAILFCDPFKVDLFKMKFFEDKTNQEIADYYKIKKSSVIYKIKCVKDQIRILLKQKDLPDLMMLREKKYKTRRQRLGLTPITGDIKQEIYSKFIKGRSKLSLSKDYMISYPVMLEIIKKEEIKWKQ